MKRLVLFACVLAVSLASVACGGGVQAASPNPSPQPVVRPPVLYAATVEGEIVVYSVDQNGGLTVQQRVTPERRVMRLHIPTSRDRLYAYLCDEYCYAKRLITYALRPDGTIAGDSTTVSEAPVPLTITASGRFAIRSLAETKLGVFRLDKAVLGTEPVSTVTLQDCTDLGDQCSIGLWVGGVGTDAGEDLVWGVYYRYIIRNPHERAVPIRIAADGTAKYDPLGKDWKITDLPIDYAFSNKAVNVLGSSGFVEATYVSTQFLNSSSWPGCGNGYVITDEPCSRIGTKIAVDPEQTVVGVVNAFLEAGVMDGTTLEPGPGVNLDPAMEKPDLIFSPNARTMYVFGSKLVTRYGVDRATLSLSFQETQQLSETWYYATFAP